MGFTKQQYIEYWDWQVEAHERSFLASYERAQSKLRLAMLCRGVAGNDLEHRIIALVLVATGGGLIALNEPASLK